MTLGTAKAGSANSAGRMIGSGTWRGAPHVGKENGQRRREQRRAPTGPALRGVATARATAGACSCRRRAGTAPTASNGRGVGLGDGSSPDKRERDERDRHAHPVDRGPAPQLDQDAAEERADHGGERHRHAEARQGARARALRKQRSGKRGRAGDRQRRADALARARPQEERPVGRGGAGGAAEGGDAAGRCGRSGDGRTGRPACRTPASASRRPARSR